MRIIMLENSRKRTALSAVSPQSYQPIQNDSELAEKKLWCHLIINYVCNIKSQQQEDEIDLNFDCFEDTRENCKNRNRLTGDWRTISTASSYLWASAEKFDELSGNRLIHTRDAMMSAVSNAFPILDHSNSLNIQVLHHIELKFHWIWIENSRRNLRLETK